MTTIRILEETGKVLELEVPTMECCDECGEKVCRDGTCPTCDSGEKEALNGLPRAG